MSALINAARGYLGVRWRHRGRSRTGLDCAGLGVLAYRDCGVELPDFVYYGREPHDDGLIRYLTAALGDPLPTLAHVAEGDVIVLRFNREPHHVALVGWDDRGWLTIVHADGQVGRVLEQRLTPEVMARITHIYRRAV